MSMSDEELLLENIALLKGKIEQLEKDAVDQKRPVMSDRAVGWLYDAFKIGCWGLLIGGVLFGLGYWIYYANIPIHETGRFYVSHEYHDYAVKVPAPVCPPKPACACPPAPACPEAPAHVADVDSCYKVVKEVYEGKDQVVTPCVKDKDAAYATANEFTEKWHTLEETSNR